ncbi:hypothetical protein [Brachybacterium huguangmaarense]
MTARRSSLLALPAAVLLLAAAGCGGASDGQGAASSPAASSAAASDGGATSSAPASAAPSATPSESGSAPATATDIEGTCGIDARDRPIVVLSGAPDCASAQDALAAYEEVRSTPEEGEDGTEVDGWICSDEYLSGDRQDEFTRLGRCEKGEDVIVAHPKGTTPIAGTPVPTGPFEKVRLEESDYAFTVAGTDISCLILPQSEYEGFGHVGCHGTVDPAAADGSGREPDTVLLDESGASILAADVLGFYPETESGERDTDVRELQPGEVIYAYGVACAASPESAVTCTAGPKRFMVSATAHELSA